MKDKDVKLTVRLSKSERELFKQRARRCGMTASEFVRQALIYSHDMNIYMIELKPFKKMLYELNKHGVNLNQLMKYMNAHGLSGYNEQLVEDTLKDERKAFRDVQDVIGLLHKLMEERKIVLAHEDDDGGVQR